jgi:predicted MPP superfamily phosphohydrolase
VQLSDSFSGFNLLLAHHPEYIGNYVCAGAGLVFSGHAHGGQFRLPLIGGLYAPGQGVLPTYDAGLYSLGNTQMIVSRGLGNSRFPFRLNNRPDLVVAALYPAE